MLLLRFRRGIMVGCVLAAQVVALVLAGAWFRANVDFRQVRHIEPMSGSVDLLCLLGWVFIVVAVASVTVWPIWCGIVRAFLPARTAASLLAWQRSQSDRQANKLASE
jgi:hypothetical protein